MTASPLHAVLISAPSRTTYVPRTTVARQPRTPNEPARAPSAVRAQALLRHAVQSGDAAEIIGRALRLLVEDLERRKAAQVTRPRAVQDSEGTSRQIPAAVRREVRSAC